MTPQNLQKVAADLLANPLFVRKYKALRSSQFPEGSTSGYRRTYIRDNASSLCDRMPTVDAESLRRYIDAKLDMPEYVGTNQYENVPTMKLFSEPASAPVHVPGCPIPIPSPEYRALWEAEQAAKKLTPTPKEPTMAKPISIETKTFINGIDATTLTDSQVYDLIASEEAKIAELGKIIAKPKKLVAEITKRQDGIHALVAHLDAKV